MLVVMFSVVYDSVFIYHIYEYYDQWESAKTNTAPEFMCRNELLIWYVLVHVPVPWCSATNS